MAESSWPDPAASEAVTDIQYEKMLAAAAAAGDGLLGTPADAPALFGDATGKHVKVRAGVWATVRGRGWRSGTSDVTVNLTDNTSGSPRVDRVVLRYDRSTYQVRVAVKVGTPASANPVEPALQQDTDLAGAGSGLWEFPLGRVAVASGYATINPADVAPEAWYLSSPVVTCTSTTRPAPLAGLQIYETDTGRQYTGTGGAWSNGIEDTGWSVVGDVAGWTSSGAGILRRINGITHQTYQCRRTGGAIGPNVAASLATLPPGYSPDRQVELVFWGTGGMAAHGYVTTNGVIVVSDYPSVINTGGVLIAHNSAWPAA